MILKVRRLMYYTNSDDQHKIMMDEFYESPTFKIVDGSAIDNKGNDIIVTNYHQTDEITNEDMTYEIVDVYLMNHEGKTIERIR